MNIYRFINSKDIRRHLEDIKYDFNALEAAWLVYQCADATLEEKHDAWKWIIENMPDMEVIERPNCVYRESLHDTLRDYIRMEEELLSEFFAPGPYPECIQYCVLGKSVFETFHSIEDATGYLRNYYSEYDEEEITEDEIVYIRRLPHGNLGWRVLANYDIEGRMISIEPDTDYPVEEYRELRWYFFDGLWFYFPTPFKKGDIVHICTDKRGHDSYDFCRGLFVLDDLITWHLKNEGKNRLKSFIEGTSGDTTDMIAYGYFMFDDGHVYRECTDNYMDLELYRGTLTGIRRLFKALSNYVKGNIELELFLYANRMFILDKQKEDFTANCFTDEGLRLAGLMEDPPKEDNAGD